MQTQDDPLIFIVEDNNIYNTLVASHLRFNKFQRIECFLSGEECLKNIYKKPDIVIQDFHLKGINGIDVLKEFKKRNPSTEFIFLSADDSYDIAANTIKYGAFDYQVKYKPNTFKRLIGLIHEIMKIHQTGLTKKHHFIGIPFLTYAFS